MFGKIMSSIHSSRHSGIIILLAAAFLLRLVVFAFFIIPHEERCFTPDASEYDRLAVNILEHRVFSFSTPPSFTPNLSRTPGYPLFLAAVYLIFGHNVIVAIFFQIVIGGIAIFLTYRLGVMLFNETVALFAALFMATSPTLIIQGNFLLTEPLFKLLLLSGLYFLTSFFIEILWRFMKYEWIEWWAYKGWKHLVKYVEMVIRGYGTEYEINFVQVLIISAMTVAQC